MTEEEWEEEQEKEGLFHILGLGPKDKNDICLEKCHDKACNVGCLQQPAYQFRPQIMQGIKAYRKQHWHRYPLYTDAVLGRETKWNCQSTSSCHDPVCKVAGCLHQPAWKFRGLIALAHKYKND
jgi:hypothetical protein